MGDIDKFIEFALETEQMEKDIVYKRDDMMLSKKQLKEYEGVIKSFMNGYYLINVLNPVKRLYEENAHYRGIMNLKGIDARRMDYSIGCKDHLMVPMIDSDMCGANKVEKFIIEGYYLASKTYATKAFDMENNGTMKVDCKQKGVQKRHLQFEHMKAAWLSLECLDFENLENIIDMSETGYSKLYT